MAAKFDIPSLSMLIAFESTGRLGGMGRAAEELKTSQSAISRHIRQLEAALGVMLFERKIRSVYLTGRGENYYIAVQSALECLHAAGHGIRAQPPSVLLIGCTQEISVQLLRPVFSKLKRSLPDGVSLRILNCDYDMQPLVVPAGVDIIFEYSVARTDADSVRVLDEEIVPVVSPKFARRFEGVLSTHPRHWYDVPRLELALRGQSWTTWSSWFAAHDCAPPHAPVESFENYFHLIEAAGNGDGLALGWNGFVNSELRTGRLVSLRDEWLATTVGLYAVLTAYGSGNAIARGCLTTLASLSKELAGERDALASPTILPWIEEFEAWP